jgi:uncharacterized protein (TIGR02266 family)
MTEQRQHPRYSINREFESIGELIDEYVVNISQGGVFIRSREPLPVGTEVDLKFTIILDDFETIEGQGRVVRTVDDGDDAGMGVEFTEMNESSREVIEEVARRAGER